MGYAIGVDTGGTFTDVVAIDENGVISSAKALSTPPNFTEGAINALEAMANELHTTTENLLKQTHLFCFGTTVGTNAILADAGSKTGLLITVGAEDTHHIARGMSQWAGLPDIEAKHQAALKRPDPIVPKDLTKKVIERIDWKGSIVCPLNRQKLKEDIIDLAENDVEGIAICFLWSVRNPVHEEEAKKMVSEMYPKLWTSVSSEVAPNLGEYERCNVAIMNAYIGPVTAKFLASLSKMLADKGLKHEMLVMKADGGSAFVSEVLPIATVHSGPVAGVIGSRYIGEGLGYMDIITADVGGTTFDVSLIRNGSVIYCREPVVGQWNVSYPMVDVRSIGAGGGSIAWVDPVAKILHVGPQSAGASPGPACYGFGGTEPTVTDASVVLGYLNPDYFLGGRMKIYPDRAYEAVKKVADQLGFGVTEAAAAIFDIINAHMADIIRRVSVERGYDPREFTLFVYGGAGPVHAAIYGAELGVKEVLVPLGASAYSALGLVTSDLIHTHMLFDYDRLPMDVDRFNKNFETLDRRVIEALERDGIKEEDRAVAYFLEMRYGLQYHVVRVPVPRKRYQTEDMDFVASEFDKVYEGIYGKGAGYTSAGRFVIRFIVQGSGRTTRPASLAYEIKDTDASGAFKGKRDAFFRKYNNYVSTSTYQLERLQPGNVIEGPAIIEAPQTTVVIPPDQKGRVDEYLNIVIK